MSDRKPLTQKQARFVELYTGDGPEWHNATLSAEGAGYAAPAVEGSKNLRNPRVWKAIEEVMAPAAQAAMVTAQSVLQELEAARIGAMRAGKYSAAVAASVAKGKSIALFTDRVETVTQLEDVQDHDLVQLIQELLSKGGEDVESVLRAIAADASEGRALPGPDGAETTH